MNRDSRYLESVLHHDIPLTRGSPEYWAGKTGSCVCSCA